MNPKSPVTELPFVGPVLTAKLKKLGVLTIFDLVYHFPHRYLDYSQTVPIGQAKIGDTVTIQGTVSSVRNFSSRTGKRVQEVMVTDQTGSISITWFNQPYLVQVFRPGKKFCFSGTVRFFGQKKTLSSPDYEPAKHQNLHTGGLVAIYPETAGISSKWLRARLAFIIRQKKLLFTEPLPTEVLTVEKLIPINQALPAIHFPASHRQVEAARKRFAFEEMVSIQLQTEEKRAVWRQKKSTVSCHPRADFMATYQQKLPFTLTPDQTTCLKEILADLTKPQPMNRLLQGDVGSGKTAVAAGAAMAVIFEQRSVVLMAPTEILARQHYESLNRLLSPWPVVLSLVTSQSKHVETGTNLFVGTHALLHRTALFNQPGLVIIDEQHRFGVTQRSQLLKEDPVTKLSPHVLSLTATPIPRTMALTLYGDLDVSVISQPPPGRQPVKTWLVPEAKRSGAYAWITKKLKKGEQAFVICPLIEDSLTETMASVRSANTEYERLKKVFPDFRLGLLHGRLKPTEKKAVLDDFRRQKTALLVATPVVEVGIDIPNATVMVIEAAGRFGLAQLHQLRGRVGRSTKQSYCLLFADQPSVQTKERLSALETIHQGRVLADLDLKLRGPGEVFGLRQHGFAQLKIATLSDTALIANTRRWAKKIHPRLSEYPALKARLKTATMSTINLN